MRSVGLRIREHPVAALCFSVFLLVLANVARETVDGPGGVLLWLVLFILSVIIGSVLLRVFWERRR